MEEFRWVQASVPASAVSVGWGPAVLSMLQAVGTARAVPGSSELHSKLLLLGRLHETLMKCNSALQFVDLAPRHHGGTVLNKAAWQLT